MLDGIVFLVFLHFLRNDEFQLIMNNPLNFYFLINLHPMLIVELIFFYNLLYKIIFLNVYLFEHLNEVHFVLDENEESKNNKKIKN